jgi:putative sterol carrier protein
MTALREDDMTIDEITAEMKAGAESKPALGKTLKFDFGDEGKIYLDGNNGNAISNADNAADCTIKVALADFIDIRSGKLNAMNAFMGGKLKVDGDMSVAMKLQSIL